MTKFLEMIKKFPCISIMSLLVFLTMTARVQGNIEESLLFPLFYILFSTSPDL